MIRFSPWGCPSRSGSWLPIYEAGSTHGWAPRRFFSASIDAPIPCGGPDQAVPITQALSRRFDDSGRDIRQAVDTQDALDLRWRRQKFPPVMRMWRQGTLDR